MGLSGLWGGTAKEQHHERRRCGGGGGCSERRWWRDLRRVSDIFEYPIDSGEINQITNTIIFVNFLDLFGEKGKLLSI